MEETLQAILSSQRTMAGTMAISLGHAYADLDHRPATQDTQ